MREIEFRAKDIDGEKWRYGKLFNDFYKPKAGIKELWTFIQVINEIGYVYPYTVDAETVGQYTGLKDKNGTKIYEGDIIKMRDSRYSYKPIYHYLIKYFDNFGMFGFAENVSDEKPVGHHGSSTAYKPYVLSQYYQSRIEVVGNIHDNPELLDSDE